MPGKPFTSLDASDAPQDVQNAISDIYDKLSRIGDTTGGVAAIGFNRFLVPDAPPSVQNSISDIYDKLNLLAFAKQSHVTIQMRPFTRLPLIGATPRAAAALNDIYDKLSLSLTLL